MLCFFKYNHCTACIRIISGVCLKIEFLDPTGGMPTQSIWRPDRLLLTLLRIFTVPFCILGLPRISHIFLTIPETRKDTGILAARRVPNPRSRNRDWIFTGVLFRWLAIWEDGRFAPSQNCLIFSFQANAFITGNKEGTVRGFEIQGKLGERRLQHSCPGQLAVPRVEWSSVSPWNTMAWMPPLVPRR